MRFEIDARDLLKAQKALKALGQPQLRKTTAKALTAAAQSIVVPVMRAEIAGSVKGKSPSPRPTWMGSPKRGKQGPLSKSVRSKQLRKRSARSGDEMIAIGVGPRAWYKHFVIQGTRAHTLAGPHGTYRMDGKGGAKVPPQGLTPWHPGAHPNDLVTRTGRKIAPQVGATLGRAILDSFAKQMKT
jgi:hypothetical protein